MASSFAWLDHSDRERRRVLDAIDRFREKDTLDELGIGSIRDAFADRFFPGTSTIQTRARYFLFIPWMYRQLERRTVPPEKVAGRARNEEMKLRAALLESEDADGTFGKRAGETLKRLASNVYWLGLHAWQIRVFAGSQDQYHRSHGRVSARVRDMLKNDDGEPVERSLTSAWHAHLPEAPEGFPAQVSFRMTPEEAEYLVERISFAAPGSLLAFLARRGRTLDADYIWMHPQRAEFPAPVREALEHAQLFAEVMQGAALLYNLMLAEALPEDDPRRDWAPQYRQALQDWCDELSARAVALSAWDRARFWQLVTEHARVRESTMQFVDAWIALAPWQSVAGATQPEARSLIRTRERQLKGARARIGNVRGLEQWNGDSGTARMSYRWEAASRILRDIHAGLVGETGANDAGT